MRSHDALESGRKPAFLYTIPTFQNPSGRTLSAERRHRLVELAREHELLVLEDDPYGLVRFDGEAPPTLFELEGGTQVAYSSSFSKTIAPGLRVGYFVLPAGSRARARGARDLDVHHARPARAGDGVRVPAPRQLRAEPRTSGEAAPRCLSRRACSRRLSASFRTRVGAGRRAATSSGSSCPKALTPATLLELCSRGGRHVRARRGLRRRAEHRAARVQLRLAGRDQRRRAQARGPRPASLQPSEPAAAHLGEVAERPRYEARLARWNETTRGCSAGRSGRARRSEGHRARRDGSSSRRTSVGSRLLNFLPCLEIWGRSDKAVILRRPRASDKRAAADEELSIFRQIQSCRKLLGSSSSAAALPVPATPVENSSQG